MGVSPDRALSVSYEKELAYLLSSKFVDLLFKTRRLCDPPSVKSAPLFSKFWKTQSSYALCQVGEGTGVGAGQRKWVLSGVGGRDH